MKLIIPYVILKGEMMTKIKVLGLTYQEWAPLLVIIGMSGYIFFIIMISLING